LAIGALSDLTGLRARLAAGATVTIAFSGFVYLRRRAILESLGLKTSRDAWWLDVLLGLIDPA
jgi:hypothetical protein